MGFDMHIKLKEQIAFVIKLIALIHKYILSVALCNFTLSNKNLKN
jgi:hypothetical protein